jgi:glycosyltransferase involved in cell wall biosynthesis
MIREMRGRDMRILVSSKHKYPASIGGIGGGRVFDCLVKGLTELGHEVFYQLPAGAAEPLPEGAVLVAERIWDVDILHLRSDDPSSQETDVRGKPWVATCHVDLDIWDMGRHMAKDNWIFVSQTLAKTYGKARYVLNAIDPAEFIYAETKENYFLFVASLLRCMDKGLDTAITLASKIGFDLIVAGSSPDTYLMQQVAMLCREHGAKFVGEVYGTRKAELFAGASALLFPTRLNEAFGLVMAEALVSGTPVICSDKGACPEIISPEVGFVCANEEEYTYAINHVHNISSQTCREKAMKDYHYLRMADDYVREYKDEIFHRCCIH